jgi:hypothetical protein
MNFLKLSLSTDQPDPVTEAKNHPLWHSIYENPAFYGISPMCNVPLRIASTASITGYISVLQISGGLAQIGQPVTLWTMLPNFDSWNAYWQLTPQGQLLCAQYQNLALGVSYGSLVLQQADPTNTSQLWTFTRAASGPGYVISNQSQTDVVLTGPQGTQTIYYGTSSGDGSGVTTLSQQSSGTDSQSWVFQPAINIPSRNFYIQSMESGLPGTGSTPNVVALYDTTDQAWTLPFQPNTTSQLWQFSYAGPADNGNLAFYIESAANQGSLLTSNSTSVTDGSNGVTVEPSSSVPNSEQQIWYSNKQQNTLYVSLSFGAPSLNVADSKLGKQLICYEVNGEANNFFYVFPEQSTAVGEWFYLSIPSTKGEPVYVLGAANPVPATQCSVEVQQLQPGNLAQLWRLNPQGQVVSAANQALYLTSNLSDGNSAYLDTQGASGTQLWCYCPNGAMVVYSSQETEILYLNVPTAPSNGGTASVQTSKSQSSEYTWNTMPFQPDTSGQWFTIHSDVQGPDPDASYLLTLNDDWSDIRIMPPLGGNVLPKGEPAFNQLWRWTLDGQLVSALNPNLAITSLGENNGVGVQPVQTGSAGQQWVWGATVPIDTSVKYPKRKFNGGTIQQLNTNDVLYANSSPVPLVSVEAAQDTSSGPANQIWYMLPAPVVYGQSTNIRNLGGDGLTPGLFLALEQGTASAPLKVILGDPQSTTWKFAYPGYITSSANPEVVLGLVVTTDDNGNWVYGPDVAAYQRHPDLVDFQLWSANQEGQLVNHQTGFALTASGVTPGSGVTTIAPTSTPNADLQLWEFTPGKALQTALVQPPVPFPNASVASQLEQDHYQAINKALGLPHGLRSQYMNLAAPLSGYQAQMNAYVLQQGVNGTLSNDWSDTLTQLNAELTSVIGIQQFFNQANAFHLALNLAQTMQLSEMVTACGFDEKTVVNPQKKGKSWIADLVEGLVYTGLNAAGLLVGDPAAGEELSSGANFLKNRLPVLSNLMATTFTAGQSGLQSRGQSKQTESQQLRLQQVMQNIYNYEMKVLQLQESLLTAFEASGIALGQIETAILADWGKISAVYDMIKTPSGLDSLYWPPTTTPMLAKQMLASYGVGLLQILMPANTSYQAYGYQHFGYVSTPYDTNELPGLDGTQTTYREYNVDETKSQFSVSIPPEVLTLVWLNNTNQTDFFRQLNGWNLPLSYPELTGDASLNAYYSSVVITVQNWTPLPLSLMIADGYYNLMVNNNQTRTLPAWGFTQVAGWANNAHPVTGGGLLFYAASGSFTINQGGTSILTVNINGNAMQDGSSTNCTSTYSLSLKDLLSGFNTRTVVDSSRQVYFITLMIFKEH